MNSCDLFVRSSIFEPAPRADAVLFSLYDSVVERRQEACGDEAFVLRQLVPSFQERMIATWARIFLFKTFHAVFEFKPLQFNILGQL